MDESQPTTRGNVVSLDAFRKRPPAAPAQPEERVFYPRGFVEWACRPPVVDGFLYEERVAASALAGLVGRDLPDSSYLELIELVRGIVRRFQVQS